MDADAAEALASAMANPVVEIPATQPSPEIEYPTPEKTDVPKKLDEPLVEVSEMERKDAFEDVVAPVAPPAPSTSTGSGDATDRYLQQVGGLGRVVV